MISDDTFIEVLLAKIKYSQAFRQKLASMLQSTNQDEQIKLSVELTYDLRPHLQTVDLATISSFFANMIIDKDLSYEILKMTLK